MRTVDIVGVAPVGIENLGFQVLSKISRAKSSSRARLLKLSTYGFCHSEPGSMKVV